MEFDDEILEVKGWMGNFASTVFCKFSIITAPLFDEVTISFAWAVVLSTIFGDEGEFSFSRIGFCFNPKMKKIFENFRKSSTYYWVLQHTPIILELKNVN